MARHVIVDGLPLAPQYSGCGINRYVVCLLREIVKTTSVSNGMCFQVLVRSTGDGARLGLSGSAKLSFVQCTPMRLRQLWKLGVFLPPTKGNGEAVFLTHPNVLLRKRGRVAVTIHDVIPLLMPPRDGLARGWLSRQACLGSLHRADLIFTDSQHSKTDIISFGSVPPGRVVVAYPGYDSELFNAVRKDGAEERNVLQRHGIRPPYLLHVGVIEPRKNLEGLVAAYRLLLNRQKRDCPQLVLCGQVRWGHEHLLRLVKESDLRKHVVLSGRVSDRELAIVYKACAGYVFPSFCEGFGLPLVEAMASGVPIACSNRSSLPEVAGDAAVYFNPESVEEMAAALEQLLTESELQKNLVERGLKRAKLFSWAECARKTVAALAEL
jgi:glycosyltransferase involved in cell wall biosynthesis